MRMPAHPLDHAEAEPGLDVEAPQRLAGMMDEHIAEKDHKLSGAPLIAIAVVALIDR
jgi:hypothetical protein